MRPEHEGVRKHEGLEYMTSDSPSGYLVESEIAMLGRLGSGGTRRARILGRVVAFTLLVAFVVSFAAGLIQIFGA
jgi:hypothetical protein